MVCELGCLGKLKKSSSILKERKIDIKKMKVAPNLFYSGALSARATVGTHELDTWIMLT